MLLPKRLEECRGATAGAGTSTVVAKAILPAHNWPCAGGKGLLHVSSVLSTQRQMSVFGSPSWPCQTCGQQASKVSPRSCDGPGAQ